MRAITKMTKTFSLDRDILESLRRTKGTVSQSERVNQLLRLALDIEKKASLEREAAEFFAAAPRDRKERQAFQKATLKALARE